jgi:hypothetical protein
VLSLTNTGIQVNTWSGIKGDWSSLYAHPSTMANSSINQKVYGNLAVTASGNAFAVVQQDGQSVTIENWQLSDDTINWSLLGNVALDKGTW